MSGIEKYNLLVLSIDRLIKHYELYSHGLIDAPEIRRGVQQIRAYIKKIRSWPHFVKYWSSSWVDLRESYVPVDDQFAEISLCHKCEENAAQVVKGMGCPDTYLCRRCASNWESHSIRAFGELYEKCFQKWIEMK